MAYIPKPAPVEVQHQVAADILTTSAFQLYSQMCAACRQKDAAKSVVSEVIDCTRVMMLGPQDTTPQIRAQHTLIASQWFTCLSSGH